MTDTLTISDLRAFKLTQDEWHALAHISDFEQERDCMDMLVLAGLAVRVNIHDLALGWELTDEGVDAADAIDLVFDWADFAHVEAA